MVNFQKLFNVFQAPEIQSMVKAERFESEFLVATNREAPLGGLDQFVTHENYSKKTVHFPMVKYYFRVGNEVFEGQDRLDGLSFASDLEAEAYLEALRVSGRLDRADVFFDPSYPQDSRFVLRAD